MSSCKMSLSFVLFLFLNVIFFFLLAQGQQSSTSNSQPSSGGDNGGNSNPPPSSGGDHNGGNSNPPPSSGGGGSGGPSNPSTPEGGSPPPPSNGSSATPPTPPPAEGPFDNCSCPENPRTLRACTYVLGDSMLGKILATARCCRRLRAFNNEQASSCICAAIQSQVIETNSDIPASVDKLMTACRRN